MDDHAAVMALFAHDCTLAFRKTVQELEVILGPDTGDLRLRTGIHSGPVTGTTPHVSTIANPYFVPTKPVC